MSRCPARPAPVPSVVDPVGAGDAFCAGFIASRIEGDDLADGAANRERVRGRGRVGGRRPGGPAHAVELARLIARRRPGHHPLTVATEAEALALDAADPLSAYRDRFLLPDGPEGPGGPPAIYLAGQLARTPGEGRPTRHGGAARRVGTSRRRGLVPPRRPVVHVRRDIPRADGPHRRRATVRGGDPQHADGEPAPDAGLVLPAGGRAAEDPDRRSRSSRPTGTRSRATSRGADWTPRRTSWSSGRGRARTPSASRTSRDAIVEHGPSLALVLFDGVNFATGQALPVARLTAAAHEVGAVVGWQLAHAAGNVPLALHDDGVDFAVWCTYKYLNGGPGSVGSIFVHERHLRPGADVPRLTGWWGAVPDHRFDPDGPVRRRHGCRRLEDVDVAAVQYGPAGGVARDLRRGRHAGPSRAFDPPDRLSRDAAARHAGSRS